MRDISIWFSRFEFMVVRFQFRADLQVLNVRVEIESHVNENQANESCWCTRLPPLQVNHMADALALDLKNLPVVQ